MICTSDNCNKPLYTRGLCKTCYGRAYRKSGFQKKNGTSRKTISTLEDAASRFKERYVIAENGCWEWLGNKDRRGYGKISVQGSVVKAHRFSYQINVGVIPDGKYILHACDNPGCVNPGHLRPGDQIDNMQDMAKRLRGYGTRLRKLTRADVIEIRRLYYIRKNTLGFIQSVFPHVDKATIRDVALGNTYKEIPDYLPCDKKHA